MARLRSAVSGSNGFLGDLLYRKLSKQGEVLRLDRTGKVPKVDIVYDLAAYGNMAGHKAEPYEVYKANTLRVARIIEQIKGTETRLIYMSTSSVSLPVQTYYSASKKASEEMIQIAVREGLKAAIARPFTVIGPGEQWEHLIPKLLESCVKGTEMPFVASPVHDFVSSDDVVDALLVIAKKGKFDGGVYEIGSAEEVTNEEIKKMVEIITRKKANLKLAKSMRAYDTDRWVANPTRLWNLGWRPKKDVMKAIKEMYDYYLLSLMA